MEMMLKLVVGFEGNLARLWVSECKWVYVAIVR